MKAKPANGNAFTFMELMTVVVTFGLMVVFALPLLARASLRANRTNCVSNLKNIGLAFRIWSNDHGEKFPMAISVTNGGSMEFIENGLAFHHFRAVSKGFGSPKILICPADKARKPAVDFSSSFNNSNLSYFIALDVDETRPAKILAGDRNVTGAFKTNGNTFFFRNSSFIAWDKSIHPDGGSAALSDGSVSHFNAIPSKAVEDTDPVIQLIVP